MSSQLTHLAHILEANLGISPTYNHSSKQVVPGKAIETSNSLLKWYGLHYQDKPIAEKLTELARTYITTNLIEAAGLGFVILHKCGNDFYFLIVCTWRNCNEIWETVFYKDGDAMADFAPFLRDRDHKPTFCVWELVPLWHEQQSWIRFLNSSRNEAAAQLWLDDLFVGQA